MNTIRKLLTKINDAIRPPHVGPLPPTDITALGGTTGSTIDSVTAARQSSALTQQTLGPK
jgi:hypothetical protein